MSRTTFQDCVEHLVDYLGGTPSDVVQRDCRRAILEAYRDFANAFRWSYLLTTGRLITSAPQTEGTIAYDHSGGTYERMVTLTGASWPAWAVGAFIRVGSIALKIAQRIDDAVVLLDEQVNPGAALAAGTAYKAYRDSYLLPEDFIANDRALYERNFGGMQYVHPREWLFEERFLFAEGTPRAYTITGDPLFPNRLLLRLCPLPTEARTIDFLYHRRPRKLTHQNESAGKVALTLDSGVVDGTGTAFAAPMVGSIFRLSGNARAPTGAVGNNPAAFESRVAAVVSPTRLVLDDAATATVSGATYGVSDPIDVEEGAMLNAFLRCMEMHVAMNRTLKDKPSARLQYKEALAEAKAADSRSFSGRAVGDLYPFRQRLRDMPIDLVNEG